MKSGLDKDFYKLFISAIPFWNFRSRDCIRRGGDSDRDVVERKWNVPIWHTFQITGTQRRGREPKNIVVVPLSSSQTLIQILNSTFQLFLLTEGLAHESMKSNVFFAGRLTFFFLPTYHLYRNRVVWNSHFLFPSILSISNNLSSKERSSHSNLEKSKSFFFFFKLPSNPSSSSSSLFFPLQKFD